MKKINNGFKIIIIALVLIVIAGAAVALLKKDKYINNYQECVKAGGAIAESYPEQCLINGKGFTNPDQKIPE